MRAGGQARTIRVEKELTFTATKTTRLILLQRSEFPAFMFISSSPPLLAEFLPLLN